MTEQSEDLEQEVETTEEAQETEGLEATAETESTAVEEEEPKQSRSQNAKQRLRRKLREEQQARLQAEERTKALEEKLTGLDSKLDTLINPPPQRPRRVDFDTDEEYEDKLFEWRDSQSSSAPVSEPSPAPAAHDVQPDPVDPEVRKNWDSQVDEASDKYEDFDEAIFSIPRESMSETMTSAIMESGQGGEVAYFLGKNHAEAARIASLSPAAQVREIDRLAGRFVKKQSSAPEPVTPLKTGGDSAEVQDLENMSPKDYRRYRNKQRPAHY